MSLFEEASLVITPNGFKAGKLYAVKGADLDVTRATSATRVNANGLIETVGANVPRIDYSGGGCPSILVEPQRTNLYPSSNDFSSAVWNKARMSIVSNTIASPDGTQNADSFVEDNSLESHPMYSYGITTIIGQNYTVSIFVKKGSRDSFVISPFALGSAVFNLTNGTTSSSNATITPYSNGFYRCTYTFMAISLSTEVYLEPAINGGTYYQGNGSTSLYIWGFQMEQGSYPTSYIPTTSAAVTRNADVISKTGISDLIGQTEGTMFFDLKSVANNEFKRLSINGGSYVNSIFFDFDNSNNLYAKVFNSGSAVVTLLASGVNIANRNKIAFAYKNNDFSFYVNGLQVGSQTSGAVPSGLDRLDFSLAGSELFQGTINSGAIFKTRLSNEKLAELTTL
jgi:hypothetical protein